MEARLPDGLQSPVSRWLRLAVLAGACVLGSPGVASGIEPPHLPIEQKRWLDDDELATRLAAFLWQAAPDPELRAWVARRQLHRPEILRSQAARLLADARSRGFVNAFVEHWLVPGGATHAASAAGRTARAPAALARSQAIFARVLRENRSVSALLDTNVPLWRERLAAEVPDAMEAPHAAARLARSLICSLVEYSRGAPLHETDASAVDDILARSKVDEYSLGTLIHEVVQSELFQTR